MKLIGPFSQVLHFSKLDFKGPLNSSNLLPIKDGGILINGGVIIDIGDFAALYKEHKDLATIIEIEEEMVVMPGLIDSSTSSFETGNINLIKRKCKLSVVKKIK